MGEREQWLRAVRAAKARYGVRGRAWRGLEGADGDRLCCIGFTAAPGARLTNGRSRWAVAHGLDWLTALESFERITGGNR